MNSELPQRSLRDGEATDATGYANASAMVKSFLIQHDPTFRRLDELRARGWSNPRGDEHFKSQKSRADNATRGAAEKFFEMMKQIGDEIQSGTNALTPKSEYGQGINILDLCMAPGGYTASALKYNPTATACGITLPRAKGGHHLMLQSNRSSPMFSPKFSPNFSPLFLDITMLVKEFSAEEVPKTHPESADFLLTRPFSEKKFHLVFCDGQVLRTHQRAEHREDHEALRLAVSQLILALQRIRQGGNLVMLLHKIDAWDTAELLYRFSQFSSIQLFKPAKKHAIRSSFYLVAKNVQPDADAAKIAVDFWKRAWWQATFGGQNGTGGVKFKPDEVYVQTVLDEFGKELIKHGQPLWQIQADALSKMDFVK